MDGDFFLDRNGKEPCILFSFSFPSTDYLSWRKFSSRENGHERDENGISDGYLTRSFLTLRALRPPLLYSLSFLLAFVSSRGDY